MLIGRKKEKELLAKLLRDEIYESRLFRFR